MKLWCPEIEAGGTDKVLCPPSYTGAWYRWRDSNPRPPHYEWK